MTIVRAFNLLDRSTTIMDDSENDTDTIAGKRSQHYIVPRNKQKKCRMNYEVVDYIQ